MQNFHCPSNKTDEHGDEVLIPSCILKCRKAGRKCDYDTVLVEANAALALIENESMREESLDKTKDHQIGNKNYTDDDYALVAANIQHKFKKSEASTLVSASLYGYKGFALMKQGHFNSAIKDLERSQMLRNIQEQQTDLVVDAIPNNKTKIISNIQHQRLAKEALVVKEALKECYQQVGMNRPLPALVKYPRTTHLFNAGGTATTKDDLILDDMEHVLPIFCNGRTKVRIEEKIDGANLGISLCPATGRLLIQNRSHYISHGEHLQFSQIKEWLALHRDVLIAVLGEGEQRKQHASRQVQIHSNRILYGEWVVARHSIPYQKLPGYFVAFHIFDKTDGRFFSRKKFHSIMKSSAIPVVPTIVSRIFLEGNDHHGHDSWAKRLQRFRNELLHLLDTKSVFRTDGGYVEGIVVRVDDDDDDDDDNGDDIPSKVECQEAKNLDSLSNNRSSDVGKGWLKHKFKIVRPDFIRGCNEGHWSSRHIEKQRIDYEFAIEYISECYVYATDDGQY